MAFVAPTCRFLKPLSNKPNASSVLTVLANVSPTGLKSGKDEKECIVSSRDKNPHTKENNPYLSDAFSFLQGTISLEHLYYIPPESSH